MRVLLDWKLDVQTQLFLGSHSIGMDEPCASLEEFPHPKLLHLIMSGFCDSRPAGLSLVWVNRPPE